MKDCVDAREAIHRRLDGEALPAGVGRCFEQHLAGCSDCREFERDLTSIQRALRGVELPRLPDAALERVRRETAVSVAGARWGFGLAAAAALAIAMIAPRLVQEAGPPAPTRAEVRHAAEDARMVFGLTARAMRRTQDAAVKRVLAEKVAPALDRVPIVWPDASTDRRDRT